MAKPNMMGKMKFGSMQHKQAAQTLKKALEEDPTVFQYDEVYDEMDKDRTEKREKAKGDKKPKYIAELMKTAERRQRENERRIEKQAQKDIEKEGDRYKDKEAFVTGAYKKKMEELRRIEEEEKRQDAIDDMAEVTKQKDLSGFYRHLYRQTMHEEKTGKEVKVQKEMEESSPAKKAKYEKSSSNEEEADMGHHGSSPRQATSRKDSESHHHHREKGKELERYKEKRHNHRDRSRDRDTDKGRRRDSDEKRHGRDKNERSRHPRDDQDRGHERRYRSRERARVPRRHRRSRSVSKTPRRNRSGSRSRSPRLERGRKSEKSGHKENRPQASTSSAGKSNDSQSSGVPIKLSEHPVWKKRTVGEALENARARYLERKQTGFVVPIIASEK